MPVNVAYQYPDFQPAMRQIAAITNANPAIVTTTFNHNYLTGTIIRLDINPGSGMAQANQLFAPIIRLSPTTFSIAIDTTQMDPFVVPSPNLQPSQTIAIGEVALQLNAAEYNVLPFNMQIP